MEKIKIDKIHKIIRNIESVSRLPERDPPNI